MIMVMIPKIGFFFVQIRIHTEKLYTVGILFLQYTVECYSERSLSLSELVTEAC